MPGPVNQIEITRVDVGRADGPLARLGRGVWPGRCLLCGTGAARGYDLCVPCAAALPWARLGCPRCALPLSSPAPSCGRCLQKAPLLDAVLAAFAYRPPVDRLLPRLKFHGDLAAGRLLAGAMAVALADAPRPQALVPVPLAPARLRQRGYDQALELARPLARALELPLVPAALRRVRDTEPQSRLDAVGRRRNLRGAFAANERGALPAHVALVDDVMTTGATLGAAAIALRRAGVERVDAWVCARVA